MIEIHYKRSDGAFSYEIRLKKTHQKFHCEGFESLEQCEQDAREMVYAHHGRERVKEVYEPEIFTT